MANRLGSIEVSEKLKTGLSQYAALEGARRTERLIADASAAYVKVIQSALEKDPAIQEAMNVVTVPKPRKIKATEDGNVSEMPSKGKDLPRVAAAS